jgi:hypothetical protein
MPVRRVGVVAVRFVGLATLIVAGAVQWAGPAVATPAPSTTTTTATAPSGPGSVRITFGSGGSFSIGSGGGLAATGPFGSHGALQRVGSRSAGGGVVLRLYEGPFSFGVPGGLPGFPAASCLPDRQVVADASTDAVAGTVTFYGRSGQQAGLQGGYVGQSEGSPVGVVGAQVPAGTRQVIMRFTGGPTDRVAPLKDGWVVLAARVKALPVVSRPVPLLTDVTPSLGTLSVVDRHGRTSSLGSVLAESGYAVPSSCVPRPLGSGGASQPIIAAPAALPTPTGPPPADPVPARQAIETAYRKIFESTANRNNNRYLEGAPVLTPAELRQLQSGYGDITGKLKVRINDFRFLNPTQAALSFDLILNGQPVTATTIGQAVFSNGQWKVARVTFCAVMSRANVACG